MTASAKGSIASIAFAKKNTDANSFFNPETN